MRTNDIENAVHKKYYLCVCIIYCILCSVRVSHKDYRYVGVFTFYIHISYNITLYILTKNLI